MKKLLLMFVVLAACAGAAEESKKVEPERKVVSASEFKTIRTTKSDWETVKVEEKGEQTTC